MIEFDQACELIFENTNQLGTEERLIENAVGYVLAQDVVSPISVAPFRNSAMDGFAVRSQWLRGCSPDNPKTMPIGSTVFAGDSASPKIAGEQALKVMTGAQVPDEYDVVVPFEETDYTEEEVRFFKPVVHGRHVRQPGEDVIRGQRLFARGSTLGRLDVGILATVGLRSITAFRKPSIKIASIGNELTNPGENLTDGRIYDSNTFTIHALVAPYGEHVEPVSCVPDREEDIRRVFESSHDVIVTGGGVSAGERDMVVNVSEACGWRPVFHKARIKPGKPLYVAVRGEQILFGLPGNPLSVAVTCAVFLIPALKKMAGSAEYRLHPQPAKMASDSVRPSTRTLIWPGFIQEAEGRRTARFSPKNSSAALTALIGTDGLIIQDGVDEESGYIDVGFVPWGQILNS